MVLLNSKSSELTDVKNKGIKKKRQANNREINFCSKLSSFTLESIAEDGEIRYCKFTFDKFMVHIHCEFVVFQIGWRERTQKKEPP